MNSKTDPYREWDVAYLLGSLSTAERTEYERHLETCAACKGEVGGLADLPSVLSALSRDQAAELLTAGTPSPAVRILRLRKAARSSRRTARAWIAVVLIAIAVVLAISVRRVFGQSGSGNVSDAPCETLAVSTGALATPSLIECLQWTN